MKRWAPTFALVAAIGYFSAHALTGERGLVAWAGYKHRLEGLEVQLTHVENERHALETRAARLRDASLDLDYLDERARALLAVGAPGDILIPARVRVRAAQGRDGARDGGRGGRR